jgi:glycosyltransferase involved in cell wall biosynthesis
LKIVQVAAPAEAGGLERVVESLAVGLHRRGHDVTVATLLLGSSADHPFVQAFQGTGVNLHLLPMGRRDYLRERRELRALFASLRPDAVHTHGYRIDLLDRGIAARLGIPTVTTVHGASMSGGAKTAVFEWLQRMNYRRFDAVVAVSRQLYERTLADGVRASRVHLVPNAWQPRREPLERAAARHALGLEDTTDIVGWVGRFIPVKGADLFIEALARMPEPRPLGVLIGYGQDAERLHRMASERGLGSRIRFVSDVRDAAPYFRAFDTYVLSSRSEGLPIVMLEAMSAGVPIVATKVGGVTEALRDDAAWLVRPEDPAALASAIAESLRDRAGALERASRASQRLADDYSIETFIDRYEDVYRQVLRG